jgi:hypothetical protein
LTSTTPKPGDVVVTMSYRGLFTVVEVTGDDVKISDGSGQTRIVRGSNVRKVDRSSDRPI